MADKLDNICVDKSGSSDLQQIRELLLEKTWFGFDLDDTLHEFRKASKSASRDTLLQIARAYHVSIGDLQKEYSRILALKTAEAFTDGKISDEYRKARFAALLDIFSITAPSNFLIRLLRPTRCLWKGNSN